MWSFSWYASKMKEGVDKLIAYGEDRAKMLVHSKIYSGEHMDKILLELKSEAVKCVEKTGADMLSYVDAELSAARKNSPPSEAPYDQRTYFATSIPQDIRDMGPKELLEHYEEVGKSGNLAHRIELKRLAGPILLDQLPMQYSIAKESFMTPEQAEAFRMERSATGFKEQLPYVTLFLVEAFDNVDSDPGYVTLQNQVDVIMSQIKENVTRVADGPTNAQVAS